MFIQRFKKTVGKKTYTSVFLVENYRDNGKIKRRYILNLSKWSREQVDAVETALKLSRQGQAFLPRGAAELQIGIRKAIGGIGVVKALCDRLKISAATIPNQGAECNRQDSFLSILSVPVYPRDFALVGK